jgi:hypothetical protein
MQKGELGGNVDPAAGRKEISGKRCKNVLLNSTAPMRGKCVNKICEIYTII